MERIFGFDIGTTSIGYAVIDHEPARATGVIHRLGVRIFPEARDPDGTPLNQQRRQKRLMRRQLRRRRLRRRLLNETLSDAGFLPPFCSKPARKKDVEAWHALMKQDPVALRKRGICEKLDPHQFGRAIYHLSKRRHFKGRELEEDEDTPDDGTAEPEKRSKAKTVRTTAESKESAEEKAAKANRDSTLSILKKNGQTLGQLLATIEGHQQRQRGIHANRSTVLNEFDRLWKAQARYHLILRDAKFRAVVENVIFAQRPVFWRKNTLGICRFMPDEDLCPRGSWLSQQRRMLEKLNNLELVGGNARPLDEEERTAILAKLQTQASMTWGSVRSALKSVYAARGEAGAERSLKFNLELDEKGTLLGNPLEAKLAGIFGNEWNNHPCREAIRDAIHQHLWKADYGEIGKQRVVILSETQRQQRRAEVERIFIADCRVTAEQARGLSRLRLPTGWEPFSTKALEQFMPHLETGIRFGSLISDAKWSGWRERSFPNRQQPTGEVLDRLPSPTKKYPEEIKRLASLRNPTVVRIQNELRKVVNNLIGLYGRPDMIRVELTREVGKSKREREKMQAGQNRQERRRKDAAADLRSKGIEPSRDDIEKWMLWKECREFDPYSGSPISFDALFRTNEFDFEHIWPRSKCFDNSFANKTLCLKALNARKANRTPFEAFGRDPEWDRMKERVWSLVKDGKMARGKAKRFCREEPLDDEFAKRQLNDTGFAARQAVALLKQLWPDIGAEAPVTVQVVTGRVTAQLRRRWRLNNILSDDGEKTRADHRHHAVDALVVACIPQGITQRLSAYWQAEDDPARLSPRLDPPWPAIRQDAAKAVAEIVVSHRVRKKVSGRLHKETTYGDTRYDVTTKSGTYRQFVTRKKVEALSKGELASEPGTHGEGIRDKNVRAILRNWVAERGGEPKKAFPPYPTVGENGPEIRKVRLLTKQQLSLMAPVSTGYADVGSNHHMAIYRLPDGTADFEVVSLYCASRRLARREPVVRRNGRDGAVFMMSLSPGDTVELTKGEEKGLWLVQGVSAAGRPTLSRINDARPTTKAEAEKRGMDGPRKDFEPRFGGFMSRIPRKISIDPIGRIRPSND